MREKLGMAALAVVLVVAWGGGFLWFRGHGSGDDPQAVKARATASSSPKAQASTSPSATPSPASRVPSALPTQSIAPLDETKAVDANPVAPRPRPRVLPPVAEFNIASFNLLGSSHTKRGGDNAKYASGPARMSGALSVLATHDVSVVGFQEFQPDQRAAFNARAGGWTMWPGLTMGRRAGENSVAWRDDTWEMVQSKLISIPYFHGRIRPMPYVQLRHKETGILVWVSTFHNPADVHGPAQKWRTIATSRQIGLFNQLEQSGVPQFVTGDMNERTEYFCRITGSTPLKAAAGGSQGGGCVPPKPTQIDWIFGSPDVAFSGYVVDRGPTVRRTTDHPVIVSHVAVDALTYQKAFQPSAEATQPPG